VSRVDRTSTGTLVPSLSVEATEHGLRFRLDVAGDGTHEPLQAEFHQRVERTALELLEANVADVLRGPTRASFTEEAKVRGGVLYRALIPIPLRSPLIAIQGPLLVSSSLHGLPWELLHDGDKFWGLRYALGRRLITDRPLPTVAGYRLPARPRALVIAADPLGDLPFVSKEMEAVSKALARVADVVAVGGTLATFDTVAAHLGRAFDLVHFAGHVVTMPGGESALLLADRRPLPTTVVEATLAGRPLVFLNGCASGEAAPVSPEGWERRLAGVVHGFLFGGAVAAVGTLADVGDRHAADLAGALYRHLFAGLAIGEALRRARTECMHDHATAASPAWLAFALYGDPTLALLADPPRGTGTSPQRAISRRSLLLGTLVGVTVTVGAGLLSTFRRPSPAPREPLVVGVMAIGVRAGKVPDWMRTFTRHALNSALKEVHGLAVFSQEKIDFMCDSRQLCGIAGAEALGMTKMITVSLSTSGDTVALDAEVIDIARNGLLDSSTHLQGASADLIDLQNKLVLRLVRNLGIEVTPDERHHILSARTNDMLDGYRMLMETLNPSPPSEAPLPQGWDRSPGRSWAAVAYAAEDDEAAIRKVLRQYEQALSTKDLDALARLEVATEARRRTVLQNYFENAKQLVVRFSQAEVLIDGSQALATYTREDTFVDAHTGHNMHLKVRISSRLSKVGGRWVLQLPQ
jgi:CHAT domain-containing protein